MGDDKLQHRIERARAALARLEGPALSASSLLDALAFRHAADVFVAECKNGPSQSREHRRLDAWVMLRSWSPITMIGYEIKIGRSDWLHDQKVADYLPLCHQLYVVAPRGVVHQGELPEGAGLLEPIGDGARLAVKRKAPYRDVVLPSKLLVYVLMCRARIMREADQQDDRGWRIEALRRWAAEKEERRELSHAVGEKIRRKFEEQERRLREQQKAQERLERIERCIVELGFDPDKHVDLWNVQERLKQLAGVVDAQTIQAIEQAERALGMVRAALEKLRR